MYNTMHITPDEIGKVIDLKGHIGWQVVQRFIEGEIELITREVMGSLQQITGEKLTQEQMEKLAIKKSVYEEMLQIPQAIIDSQEQFIQKLD